VLVVRVEIWPGGDARALRQIEVLTIVNVGLVERGEHVYEARHAGAVAEVRHRQSDGALELVSRAINALAALGVETSERLTSQSSEAPA
jgi:hypothetical protein